MKCANCDRELPADEHGTTHSDFGDCWRNTRHELLAARKVVKAAKHGTVRAEWGNPLHMDNALTKALADYDKLKERPQIKEPTDEP